MVGIEAGEVEPVATAHGIEAVVLGIGRHPKAGGQHEHVDLTNAAVERLHTGGGDPLDRLGDQLYVWLVERPQIAVRDRWPLAADLVIGCQSPAELAIADLAVPDVAPEPAAQAGDPAELVVVDDQAHQPGLDRSCRVRVDGPMDGREPAVERLDPARSARVDLGADPDRRALIDVKPSHVPSDLGHDLDRARASPDHSRALRSEEHTSEI